MNINQGAANCTWAVPTLDMPAPEWVDASDRPWTCLRDVEPRELESTDQCRTCDRWQPREAAPPVDEPCEHLRAGPFFLDLFEGVRT